MHYPKYYGFLGFILITTSFLCWLLPSTNPNLILFQAFFYLGNILFFDYISDILTGFSLLRATRFHRISHFLILGFLFGGLLELYLHWLGKFWYYPYWSVPFYVFIFVPGFAVYAFYLIETYLGIKAILNHFLGKIKEKKENLKGAKKLFISLGLIGALGIGSLTTLMITQTTIVDIKSFLSVNYAPKASSDVIYIVLLLTVCFWFFFEYLEYEEHETSLLYEMLRGNFIPVLSVFIAAWISAVLYEFLNAPGGLWKYANFPFSEYTIFQVPVIALLLWPFHYFPMFSLYRVIFKKETKHLW